MTREQLNEAHYVIKFLEKIQRQPDITDGTRATIQSWLRNLRAMLIEAREDEMAHLCANWSPESARRRVGGTFGS